MTKYRKKPIEIEAWHFTRKNIDYVRTLCESSNRKINFVSQYGGDVIYLEIETLEGVMRADEGDFIIKGVKGEYYPCKPDVFEMTYEKV